MKTNSYRFTLSFNPNDPDQCKAAEIINSKRRGKSRFISAAVLFYVQEDCKNETLESRVRRLVDQILSEKGDSLPVKNGEKSANELNVQMGAALLGGLDAFQ